MVTELIEFERVVQSMLSRQLTSAQRKAFAWYAEELMLWNARFNLTAITERSAIEVRHFLDSLTCLLALGPAPSGRVVDVGTGAGFPGLPLKILCPQLDLTLIEATRKKVDFCQHVVKNLGLHGVEVIHARAEDLGHDVNYREQYDYALARAVAPLRVLVEYLLPLLNAGGVAVAQKGETAPAEAHAAEEALRLVGGHVERLIPLELPGVAETRYLVVITKVAATPAKFPRKAGIPSKRPLG